MKILSRFVYEGKSCYNVAYDEEARDVEPVSIRGLYEEDKMEGLIAAGYKYRDYHGDILTPTGERISDLVESPCIASVKQLQDMKEIEENPSYVLSEAEAARYFDRTIKVESIKLREPVEIKIKTRQELITYLQSCNSLSQRQVKDVRPLNAITAPEALFTPDELVRDREVQSLMAKVEQRRTIESLKGYQELVTFLQEHAGLQTEFTESEFMRAYLSWGVCGLRFPITETHVEERVQQNIDDLHDLEASEFAGKRVVYAPYDAAGNIYTDLVVSNWADGDETLMPAATSEEAEYYKKRRRAETWSTKYQCVKVLEPVEHTRWFAEGISEDGAKVRVRIDPGEMMIFIAGAGNFRYRFLRMRVLGALAEIKDVNTHGKMALYNLSKAVARDSVRKRTVKCPVGSTVEMLTEVGLSDVSSARYLGRKLAGAGSSQEYLRAAWKFYQEGPDDEMIQGFNPGEAEYSNMSELVAIISEQKSVFEEEGKYPLTGGANDIAPGSRALQMEESPVEQLEFVQSVMDGTCTVGDQYAGRGIDSLLREEELISLIRVTVMTELKQRGLDLTVSSVLSVLQEIVDGKLLDLSSVIYERDAECKGYLKDKAAFFSDMSASILNMIWVTKVFREIGNCKAEDLRHYMFECFVFPLNKNSKEANAFQALCDAMGEAVTRKFGEGLQSEILRNGAAAYISNLVFAFIFKKAKYRLEDGVLLTTVTVKDADKNSVELEIAAPISKVDCLLSGNYGSGAYLRYCTLQEYVDFEFDRLGRQRTYCVNAEITPWYVIPKDGHTLYSYNYLINYYTQDTCMSALPKELLEKIAAENARVTCVKDTWGGHMLYEADSTILSLGISYEPENIDSVLDYQANETPADYVQRWQFKQKAAKAAGHALHRMALRSDVIWKNFARPTDRIVTEESTVEEVSLDAGLGGLALKDVRVLRIQEKKQETLEVKTNKVTRFRLEDCCFEDLQRWLEVVSGGFTPSRLCVFMGGVLLVLGANGSQVKVDLWNVGKESLDKLAEKGVIYRLAARKYLIRAGEDYVVEM